MTQPVRIFITSHLSMWRAELALEYSIYKYAVNPVEVTFIRSGDPKWLTNVDIGMSHNEAQVQRPDVWNVGRDHGTCFSKEGWATPFSCMRFCIPELCQFEGRAIHMDVDFLVVSDLKDIFDMKLDVPMMGPAARTDFLVIDCAAFKDLPWWPSIAQMRPSGWHIEKDYKKLLIEHDFLRPSLEHYESWDGNNYIPGVTKTIHYTNMHTQPWKPLPSNFAYPPHPNPVVTYLFWEHYAEALERAIIGEFTPQTVIPKESYAEIGFTKEKRFADMRNEQLIKTQTQSLGQQIDDSMAQLKSLLS